MALASWALITGATAAPQTYDAKLRAARRALGAEAFAQARQACRAAAGAAEEPAHGGPRTARAWALCGDVERAADRMRAAAQAYARAARASVHAPKQRRRLLAKRRRAAFAAKARSVAKRVTALLQHDAKVQAVLRRPGRRGKAAERAAKEMLEAQREYRKDRDRQQARLAGAARALVLAHTERRALAVKVAERILEQPAPRPVTVTAWRALYQAHRGAEDLGAAVDAAVGLERAKAAADTPPEYRGRVLTRACRALDRADGPGACTRRQLSKSGAALLSNHALRRVRQLRESELGKVHADALPALQACVLDLARTDPERYRGEELRFSWAIGPDGAPIEPEVRPRRHVEGAAACLELIARFRYPRSPATAERRNVSVPYQLN